MSSEDREKLKALAQAEGCSVQTYIMRKVFSRPNEQQRPAGRRIEGRIGAEAAAPITKTHCDTGALTEDSAGVRSKGGRPFRSGGPRRRVMVSLPVPLAQIVYNKAADLGISVSDVIVLFACRGADLPLPDYITKVLPADLGPNQATLL